MTSVSRGRTRVKVSHFHPPMLYTYINPGSHLPTHAAIRLSRHARMMFRPNVPTQQMQPSAAHAPHTHTRVHRAAAFRRPAPTQLRVSPPTPLCSAEQQLATYATIKVSVYPQPCSTPHIKRATHYPPLAYLSPAQHSLGGPCTQMPTLKNFSNAVESAAESVVNLAERATGVDIDKDGDTGVNLTQP